MSYDIESALITRILEEADLRSVIRQKVTPSFFSDEHLREVYHWLVVQYQKHGRVPSIGLVGREFPAFDAVDTDDDLMQLVDELKKAKLYGDMAVALKDVTDATKEDPSSGFEMLRRKAGELSVIHSGTDDQDVTKSTQAIRDEYERLKAGEGMLGVPYPWEYMNKITLGMHPGELIGFYARPKSLKTWVSLYIANWVHEQYGIVPAYFSCEMPVDQIRRRLASLRAKVPYGDYRAGALGDAEEKRFFTALEELEESPPFMLCQVTGTGDAAITEVRSKCEEYQAEIAIVDGAYYMMDDSETHRSFRTITRGLKKVIAEQLKIPVLMTTQANRSAEKTRGANTSEVAFGDSLAQDCDQLIRIIRDPQHREARELLLTMPALREAEGGTFTIHAIPSVNFEQKFVMEGETAQQALEDTDDGMIT